MLLCVFVQKIQCMKLISVRQTRTQKPLNHRHQSTLDLLDIMKEQIYT